MTFLGFDRRDARSILSFFRMFLRDRFLGSRLGTAWALVNPLLMLGIYTFVFGFVFKARLPGAESTLAYAIWLVAGYGPWLAINESLNSSAQSLIASSGLVKNMAFKTECLPLAASALGLVPLTISIVFASLLMVADGHAPSWHAVAALPGLMLTFAFLAALGLGLSAVTTVVRDFAVVLPTLMTVLLFASPIFYPLDAMPAFLRSISQWNPFYLLVEFIRRPIVFHTIPPLWQWVYVSALTVLVGGLNLVVFRRLKGSLSSLL